MDSDEFCFLIDLVAARGSKANFQQHLGMTRHTGMVVPVNTWSSLFFLSFPRGVGKFLSVVSSALLYLSS